MILIIMSFYWNCNSSCVIQSIRANVMITGLLSEFDFRETRLSGVVDIAHR